MIALRGLVDLGLGVLFHRLTSAAAPIHEEAVMPLSGAIQLSSRNLVRKLSASNPLERRGTSTNPTARIDKARPCLGTLQRDDACRGRGDRLRDLSQAGDHGRPGRLARAVAGHLALGRRRFVARYSEQRGAGLND